MAILEQIPTSKKRSASIITADKEKRILVQSDLAKNLPE